MKKPDQRALKLHLSTETVRELSQQTLTAVAGATTLTCTFYPKCKSAPDGQ